MKKPNAHDVTAGKASRHVVSRKGYYHRVLIDERSRLDEVVLIVGRRTVPRNKIVRGKVVTNPKADQRSGLVVHLEAMNGRDYFCDIAGVAVWIHTGKDGVARITGVEDRRPPAPHAVLFEHRPEEIKKGKRK